MSTQVTNYQCPACVGPMHFDASSGKLECDYCGNVYDVAQVEAMFAKENEKAAQALAKEEGVQRPQAQQNTQGMPAQQGAYQQGQSGAGQQGAFVPPIVNAQGHGGAQGAAVAGAPNMGGAPIAQQSADGAWDTSGLSSNWEGLEANMRSYSCPSCSAQIICDSTTAATSCVYCGNPTIVPGRFDGALKPDYIIPFKIEKKEAKEALKKHCEKKFLLPKFFAQEAHIEEIKGVYVPFWLFDGTVSARAAYKATTSTSYTSGDYRVTKTNHYDIRREGDVTFLDIPVDSSSKMPDKYMESIEPYDYRELKPFSMAYMPGFLADKYDVSVEQCSQRADDRAINTAFEIMKNSVTGYSACTQLQAEKMLHRGTVQYAMAPVWMLSTKWRGSNYLFAMNGQTGKFVGDLPCDNRKYALYIAGLTAAITAFGSLIYLFLF